MLPHTLVSRVRVRKGKEWQMLLNDRQHFGHPWNDAKVDVVPPCDEILVREVDAQRLAQRAK